MIDSDDDARLAAVREISEVIERHGEDACAQETPEAAARQWLDAGFDDPEEIEDWLRARCFNSSAAQALESAGITPEHAAIRTTAGAGDYEETLGHKFTRGDLSIDEARRIITNYFWNS